MSSGAPAVRPGVAAATSKRVLPGPASRSYNVASIWEKAAILTPAQESAVDLVSEVCGQRPVPDHVEPATARLTDAPGRPVQDIGELRETLEEVVLHSSNEFYRWHTELEAARVSETEEKYQRYGDTLRGHYATCHALLAKVQGLLEMFDLLQGQHRDVASKTKALHDACERLVAEKERLAEFSESVRAKLAFFDELEIISAQFHSASLAVESDKFVPILRRLDECIMYMSSNPQYADSATYAGKFRQLQARAMATMRTKVQQVLRTACDQVQAAIRESRGGAWSRASSAAPAVLQSGSGTPPAAHASTPHVFHNGRATPSENGQMANGGLSNGGSTPLLAEGTETALLYVRFRAVAEPGLKGLLHGIEARGARPEYGQLLGDCQRAYCAARFALVGNVTRARLAALARQPLPTLTRSGCAYLMQVCQLESQLFQHFFPREEEESGALAPLMDPLCMVLYDMLRPAFIQLQDLDDLCEIVDILLHEVLEEQLAWRGGAVAPLRPALLRTLADVQHRLTFRAQAFIKEVVVNFQPTSEDLDYPAKLERLLEEAGNDTADQPGSTQDDAREEQRPLVADNGEPSSSSEAVKESASNTYGAWYPPVQQTLTCLSKLYRSVEHKVFAGLAQDAIAACTAAVQLASKQVAKRAGVMDGELFLIKQLLILREQIAPFDAEFSVVEKDLDFSHMRDYLRRILAGQASLFSLSSDNAVLQMFSKGGPRILENQVDSKRELEKLLKLTCEAFIMAVTKSTVEAMLSFLTKVTAVRVRNPRSSTSAQLRPLREQAFAAPERVTEMVAKVRSALKKALPSAITKLKLYLNNPATHVILLRPIKSNIAEAHAQIATLLAAEYTNEEIAAINLPASPELAGILDALLD